MALVQLSLGANWEMVLVIDDVTVGAVLVVVTVVVVGMVLVVVEDVVVLGTVVVETVLVVGMVLVVVEEVVVVLANAQPMSCKSGSSRTGLWCGPV